MMRYRTNQLSKLLIMLLGLMALDVRADTTSADQLFDSVTVYMGQGVNHNLKEIPERIFAGNPEWEGTYFSAVGLGKSNKTLSQHWSRLDDTPLEGITQGYEMMLVQHRGMQGNAELGVANTLKSTDLVLGAMGLNIGVGVGLSYALGVPTYEDGTTDDPARRYRLQLLLLFDLEWKMLDSPDWSFVTRVHHRSGGYGLIAPRHVGSNFLVAGLRYKF